MRFYSILLLFLAFCFLQSCVSHKQVVYLQPDRKLETDSTKVIAMATPYKVQINDILYINLKTEDQDLALMFKISDQDNQAVSSGGGNLYFQGYTVDDHGNIRIPILGEMNVLGFTLEEIRKRIETSLLNDYLTEDAKLFVTVKLAGFNYSVLGEVGSPGSNVIYKDRVNILEAIANAGDIPITGNRQDVMIIRQFPDKQRIFHVDLTSEDLLNSPYYYLKPNDMIYVKPLKQKTLGTGTTGLSTFTTIFSVFSVLVSTVLLIKNL
ncbi:polysaccharide biosynthesis/export family protein [Zhouia sp. PK063]|uniref:polysaccharide biosynthesis/export family protein n=1 Tax=Zhouia sp. PK063 TaxID=3373602 RepID=UPI0037AEBD5B